MNILLLVAHGSRREESNLEVEALSKKMIEYNTNDFDQIMPAFLEFASPQFQRLLKNVAN